TLRRCRGVYLFHRIPDVNGQPGYDGLVSGLRFTYEDNEGVFSLLTEATATGYRREENGDYTSLDGPPFSLNYQAHAWNTTTGTFAEDAMADPAVTFLDLYGDGMNGILHRQNGLLYYRENQGEGRFSPPLALTEQPVGTFFQLTEIEGNGRKNATDLRSEAPGYHTWLAKDHLDSFRYFPHAPRLNPTDDAIRFIDLTGDGRPDILLTENAAFSWHQSLGEDGYEAARKTLFPLDEAGHPEIVLHGPDTLVLADMSGDGLTDLVRIRNGSVAYWPNLGYGRFGRRRDMAGAPVFAAPDQFDAARIRLADLDGSGVADLFYLDENGVRVWLNRSGNGWQPAPVTIPMPVVDDLSTVRVLDLLGTGTACLIWTTSKEGVEPGGRVAYVDLMEGAKPYLLSGYRNN
ncbi:MAG: VCBS repeat-containing protein, partial [Bacteroidota bacterium]